jgi:hypothetical protein
VHRLSEAVGGASAVVRLAAVVVALAMLPAIACGQQQHADSSFRPTVPHPAYVANGPVVAVDQAHRNFHTLDGKYAPFGKLLSADGYRVRPNTEAFSAQSLAGVNVLVVSNALPSTPGMSAFTPDEIAAVRQWVQNGGALLLIADHAPFGTASALLSQAFGVDMGAGFVVVRQYGKLTANIDYRKAQLGSHPIMQGRNPSEQVKAVESFTGQSLGIPPGATGLLLLPNDAVGVASPQAIDMLRRGESVPGKRVGGRAQAEALNFGRGRVVITGEAAMFTEQVFPWGEKAGLTVEDDEQFALNVLHWLSRLI